MRYYLSVLILSLGCTFVFGQKIATNNSLSMEQLSESAIGKNYVAISTMSSSINGAINNFSSYDAFEKSDSNFPFENGIVVSTGSINSTGNSNTTTILIEGDETWGTDSGFKTTLDVSLTLYKTFIEFNFGSKIITRFAFFY